MEKSEWPNEARLATLREAGIVPYSPFATAAAGCAALALTALVLKERSAKFFSWLSTDWPNLSLNLATFKQLMEHLVVLLVVPCAALIVTTLVVNLLQTRFLLRPKNLLSFERLNPLLKMRGGALLNYAGRSIIIGVAAFGFGILTWVISLRTLLGLLNLRAQEMPAAIGQSMHTALIYSAIITLVLTGVAWFLARMLFLNKHRMSRAEVLQEEA